MADQDDHSEAGQGHRVDGAHCPPAHVEVGLEWHHEQAPGVDGAKGSAEEHATGQRADSGRHGGNANGSPDRSRENVLAASQQYVVR